MHLKFLQKGGTYLNRRFSSSEKLVIVSSSHSTIILTTACLLETENYSFTSKSCMCGTAAACEQHPTFSACTDRDLSWDKWELPHWVRISEHIHGHLSRNIYRGMQTLRRGGGMESSQCGQSRRPNEWQQR